MVSLLKTVFLFLMPIWVLSFKLSYGRIFTFKMHHRFSEPVKNWSNSTGKLSHWPVKGSFEYYAVLAHRDRLLRGRQLSGINAPISFSDGNSTFRISSLGFLHYTTVQLGTPGVKFMVALDTGSDLFWVPCDCNKCAPTEGTTYASDFELSIYDPKGSSTSKKVTCNSSLCALRNQCLGTFSNCPYMVSYMSAQTSTSGVLVEDVLHLTTEDGHPELVKAYVTFGPTYNITITQIRVGTTLIDDDFTALFDSGTSFTYLVDPTYSNLSENFHSQAQDRRRPPDSRIPFEYCYDMSPDANASLIPSMSLTMKGESHFPVYDPIIVISTQSKLVYCLAVVKSTELNIIGQNFMTGYRVVFDRERFVLGWKKFDCYDIDETSASVVESHAASAPPAFAVGIRNYSTPEATKDIGKNNSHTSFALRSCHFQVSPLSCLGFVSILSLLL
ncbi:Xylanase inhibitor [Theobroma cacao]|nr:Xylanase inhibitor [Theobroma cacao]